MKIIKNTISDLAFIIAFGVAFATSNDHSSMTGLPVYAKASEWQLCEHITECTTVDTGIMCQVSVYKNQFFDHPFCNGGLVTAYQIY